MRRGFAVCSAAPAPRFSSASDRRGELLSRRLNEVDAALLLLEGRTHGRGGRLVCLVYTADAEDDDDDEDEDVLCRYSVTCEEAHVCSLLLQY